MAHEAARYAPSRKTLACQGDQHGFRASGKENGQDHRRGDRQGRIGFRERAAGGLPPLPLPSPLRTPRPRGPRALGRRGADLDPKSCAERNRKRLARGAAGNRARGGISRVPCTARRYRLSANVGDVAPCGGHRVCLVPGWMYTKADQVAANALQEADRKEWRASGDSAAPGKRRYGDIRWCWR